MKRKDRDLSWSFFMDGNKKGASVWRTPLPPNLTNSNPFISLLNSELNLEAADPEVGERRTDFGNLILFVGNVSLKFHTMPFDIFIQADGVLLL